MGRNSFRSCRDLLKWQQHFDDLRMQCTELPAGGAPHALRQVFLRANDRKVTYSLSLLPCTM
jgi:hypothetical protein